MYVRSKSLLLVVLPPQVWVLGDVLTVSIRPPCVPYVSVGPLSKSPCRAPSMNAASTRGILVYAHTVHATAHNKEPHTQGMYPGEHVFMDIFHPVTHPTPHMHST
jgi:hypothetical protein